MRTPPAGIGIFSPAAFFRSPTVADAPDISTAYCTFANVLTVAYVSKNASNIQVPFLHNRAPRDRARRRCQVAERSRHCRRRDVVVPAQGGLPSELRWRVLLKMGAHRQRSKRRWEDGRKNSGPIFCRRPEGTEKIKVRMKGLMVLKSGGAGALDTAHSTLPRVWREAGMKGR